MNIVVVEPHPDDAFLSLGWHIKSIWPEAGYSVHIITVYADKRRGAEAQAYADFVGAQCTVMGLEESKMDSDKQVIRKIPALVDLLTDFVGSTIVVPLGLQHPDHLRVTASKPLGSWRYVDTPYYHKLKIQPELNGKCNEMVMQSIVVPPKKKWDAIPIFKSQAKFFHFNPMAQMKSPEIVLS